MKTFSKKIFADRETANLSALSHGAPAQKPVSLSTIAAIHDSDYGLPADILGIHPQELNGTMVYAIRVFRPDAHSVSVKLSGQGVSIPMRKAEYPFADFFELTIPFSPNPPAYVLNLADPSGKIFAQIDDPYQYFPVITGKLITPKDLELFAQGKHYKIYDKLGAHPTTVKGHAGYHFAVWAPNARRVSLVADYNNWDGRITQMNRVGHSGIWEIFIPGLKAEIPYKFEIRTQTGQLILKADPYANAAQIPEIGARKAPDLLRTASVTTELGLHQWQDEAWMTSRAKFKADHRPMSIYEVHLGSWMQTLDGEYLDYKALAHNLVDYVTKMGYTHIELLPLTEYPYHGSWGYQVTGFYAPTSRYGKPEDLMYFIDLMHQNNIGVFMDWVPCHFPKDAFGLARFDGTGLYEPEDPQDGEIKGWGTHAFNYRRHEVSNFLIANALFWLDKYHLDGLRVDAVAYMISKEHGRMPGEWKPNAHGGEENLAAIAFLKKLNQVVHQKIPGVVMIAEDSSNFQNITVPAFKTGALDRHRMIHGVPFAQDHLATFFINPEGDEPLIPKGSLEELLTLVDKTITDQGQRLGWKHLLIQGFGLGFDLKWDMGWMNDLLSWRGDNQGFMRMDPLYRKYNADRALFRAVYQHKERYAMPVSHDEVVHGKGSLVNKMHGDMWQQFAQARLTLAWMYGLPGKKVLFQGLDIAQHNEWDQLRSVDWHVLGLDYPGLGKAHAGFQQLVKDLNFLYSKEPALHQLDLSHKGFQWINNADRERTIFSFLRKSDNNQNDQQILAVFNFTPRPWENYWVGVPRGGRWKELFNSDAKVYGGSGFGNRGQAKAVKAGQDNQPYRLQLRIPPFGALFFKPMPEPPLN